MDMLIEKLEQLKEEISKTEEVISYLEEKKNIFSNQEVISKVDKYRQYPSEELKEEVEKSSSFLAYKEKETEVNLLIFAINHKFKELSQEFDCRKEG